MKRLQEEQYSRHRKISGLVIWALFVAVALLSAGRVFAANRLVETSENLRRLDQEVDKLETQNQILAQELRSQESIETIQSKAAALGFIKANHYAYLSNIWQVALAR